MASYLEEIHKSLIYPTEAKEKGIDGKVFVQFIVRSDGSLTEVKTVKGIGHGCDEEAVRVVKEGPGWVAGRQRGRAVNVRMILQITFTGENKIMGTIVSADRKPLPGANVVIKGTTTGTVTDNLGSFVLEVEPDHKELVISYIGYISQNIKITPGKSYSIEMQVDPNNLSAPNLLGVVEDDKGLQIRTGGKDLIGPGKKPLYVIEGHELEDFNDINIKPEDINSITVVKDPKQLEKYGEKGKNGVIFIDLKEGVEYKTFGQNLNFKDNPPIIIVNGMETQLTMDELEEKHPVESIDKISVLKDASATEKYGKKGKNGVIIVETRPLGAYRSKLDKMPDYPGGMEAFYKTIQKNIKYPSDARKENIEGKVLVSFTLARDGAVKDIKAEKSVYVLLEEIVVVGYSNAENNNEQTSENQELSLLEEEVIRNIKLMDNFKPGTKNGEPVEVRMTLPVTFKLQ
jgi:TonB family protein